MSGLWEMECGKGFLILSLGSATSVASLSPYSYLSSILSFVHNSSCWNQNHSKTQKQIIICKYLLVSKRLRDPNTIRTRVIISCSYYFQNSHLQSIMCLVGLTFLFLNLLEAQYSHSSSSRKIRKDKLQGPEIRVGTGVRCLFPSAVSGPIREERFGASWFLGISCDQTCVQFSHWSLWVEEIFV